MPVGSPFSVRSGDVLADVARQVRFIGAVDIAAASSKIQMMDLADELITHQISDPNAEVSIHVEIQAEFPDGVDDSVKRTVSENAKYLKLKYCDWKE